jgi:predicted Zn finger-like uncharacterized protein
VIEVTCEQCQVAYKVEERLLGKEGRMVRCMDCMHIWHQAAPPSEEEEAPPEEAQPVEPETPDWLKEEEPKDEELELVSKEKGKYFHESEMDIPDSVKPQQPQLPAETAPQPFQIPVMDYRPLGMAAGQFGVFVFLALTFVTLSGLFIAKRTVVSHMPSMAYFYTSIGFDMKAPGEGLSLSELTAESRVDGRERTLAIQAKLSNITDKELPQPSLRVQLKGAYGAILKKWEFSPESAAKLAAGESMPLELSFNDPPEDGKTVELKVIDR